MNVTWFGTEDVAKCVELVREVMTAHWDMAACQCWFCREGRAAGVRPSSRYLHSNGGGRKLWPERDKRT